MSPFYAKPSRNTFQHKPFAKHHMNKFLCLLSSLLLLCLTASAQGSTLERLNLQQAEILKIGMFVLGAWALLNILIGSVRLTKTSRNKRFFFQMNIYWNILNLLIAAGVLYYILSNDPAARTLPEAVSFHYLSLRLLYLSTGLALAFLTIGSYLKERSRSSPKTDQYLGWGQSITLQALVLLLLGIVLVALLEQPAEELLGLLRP